MSFGSDVNVPPVSARDDDAAKAAGEFSRIEHGGGGEATQLLCGFLGSDNSFGPLLSSLPPVLKLDVRATPSGAWMESSFRFAVSQIAAGRVGSTTVIAKLSELLFVEAVSHYIAGLPEDRQGWLAGLRDPQIGRALALMHARPAKEWSAEALAAEVGMWRSGFAERFTSLVGQPPMQYLACWRMQLAARSCGSRATPLRRWDCTWGMSPRRRSVGRSRGSLVRRPRRGGAQPARANRWRLILSRR